MPFLLGNNGFLGIPQNPLPRWFHTANNRPIKRMPCLKIGCCLLFKKAYLLGVSKSGMNATRSSVSTAFRRHMADPNSNISVVKEGAGKAPTIYEKKI
jgi:hypothetical protein